ncbi:putative ABC transport system ATP-binding protein [Austwickia chelonae]|uniref:Putative ABC transporter permease/ATP-binding protein n=1 Tax=Austwickia chelonae NBRC 105200 TaxID=1184607 RepID=K6W6J7_9MICO|nr:ABC transporter ATP-binding protein [Austwickia chelonae]GAB77467.1 putative ABC transporter permease/ATP-binding protein [Austwickia chelonae NBRC 105200]SEW11027.1 putative ABC transport system ATP-binding protein [Austwickia chelonae]
MTVSEGREVTGGSILATAIRRNIGAVAGGTALMCLYQAGETSLPIVLGRIVGNLTADRSWQALALSVAVLAVTIATVSLSWRFGMRILQKANTTEAHRWRVEVAACGLRPAAGADVKSGEMLVIATEDADQAADIVEVVPMMISALVSLAIATVALSVASPWLGFLVMVGTLVILSVLSVLSARIGASTKEQQVKVARAGAKVADLIAGLRPLHGFGGPHAAFASYRTVSTEARRQAITVARINGVYAGTALALNASLASAVTLTAGWLAVEGRIGVGELIMAVGLAQFIMEPLRLFSEMPKYVMVARASAERMASVLSVPPVAEPGAGGPLQGGAVEVDGLRHRALQGVSFSVPAGGFVAVAAIRPQLAVDLMSVLALQAAPGCYEGVVRVGGRPLAELPVSAVREHLLVNPHSGEIFAGTLRSNIDPSGRSRSVSEAVSASMLSDVVALHREGLDYEVRDRGANLSGGQRQRLSLARALAADAEVLVLHDPTTAVDAVTEQRIAREVVRMRRGRTTIVFTTSPALLDVADRVLVLDEGVVVGEGTHRELLVGDGSYAVTVTR